MTKFPEYREPISVDGWQKLVFFAHGSGAPASRLLLHVEFLLDLHLFRTSFLNEADGRHVLKSKRAATGEWKKFACYRLGDRRSIGDGDDDVALLVSPLDLSVGFGDPLQRVSPVDHRLQLPRLGELPEPDEIVAAKAR
jgi:hypothetical protein